MASSPPRGHPFFPGHRHGVAVSACGSCRDGATDRPQTTSGRWCRSSDGMDDLARGAERGGRSGSGRVVVWLAAARTLLSRRGFGRGGVWRSIGLAGGWLGPQRRPDLRPRGVVGPSERDEVRPEPGDRTQVGPRDALWRGPLPTAGRLSRRRPRSRRRHMPIHPPPWRDRRRQRPRRSAHWIPRGPRTGVQRRSRPASSCHRPQRSRCGPRRPAHRSRRAPRPSTRPPPKRPRPRPWRLAPTRCRPSSATHPRTATRGSRRRRSRRNRQRATRGCGDPHARRRDERARTRHHRSITRWKRRPPGG